MRISGLPTRAMRRSDGGSAARPRRAGALMCGSARGQRLHDFGVELRAGASPELGERVARAARRPVGARARHRVERVGDVDDAGEQRDLVAVRPCG